MENSGIGICITREIIDISIQKKINEILKSKDKPTGAFQGQQLILIFDKYINIAQFRKNISRITLQNKCYCHIVIIGYNKAHIVLLDFNKIFRIKNIAILYPEQPPTWYDVTLSEYTLLIGILEYTTYEQMHDYNLKSSLKKKLNKLERKYESNMSALIKTIEKYQNIVIKCMCVVEVLSEVDNILKNNKNILIEDKDLLNENVDDSSKNTDLLNDSVESEKILLHKVELEQYKHKLESLEMTMNEYQNKLKIYDEKMVEYEQKMNTVQNDLKITRGLNTIFGRSPPDCV